MSFTPLSGIRVLDLTRLLPGPLCTLVLSDLGADVVKIEDPKAGDYLRMLPPFVGGRPIGARFAALNRGKRSLALDLKTPSHRETFLRMATQAQVVVETFRPGVLDRLGIGFAALCERNPKIVLCSISGYGQDGPWRNRAGHDANYCATAGVLDQAGSAGGPPEILGVQVADCAGALWGVIGIVSALYSKHAEHVDISMTEAAMSFMIPMLGLALNDQPVPARGTDRLTGGVAAYNVYPTQDGYMALGALEPKFWQAFNEAIGRKADVGNDPVAPPDAQARIREEISEVLAQRTSADWAEELEGQEVCCEPVLELCELPDHPLHQARRNCFEEDGLRYARTPLGGPRTHPSGTHRPPPLLGEQSAEVLSQYGFSPSEITAIAGKDRTG